MICYQCNSEEIKVLESRDTEGGFVIRRRRECESCKYRFTTFERIALMRFIVFKKDGTREPYNREKLIRSIWMACSKRPVSQKQIDEIVSGLEQKWNNMGKEVESHIIGHNIMEALKKIDEIAYIRFASVYRDFKDVETFQEELKIFLQSQKKI